jgi:type IV pilus assembly protein PilA
LASSPVLLWDEETTVRAASEIRNAIMQSRTQTGANNRDCERISVRGFSLIELLIVIAIILIIAAIAIPNFMRSRMAANQAAAAETVRTITTASVVYSTTWNNGYAPSLAALGGPPPGPPTCNASLLLDDMIASGTNQKSGYVFLYFPQGANVLNPPPGCVPGFVGYLASTHPINANTGQVSYCSNEPGVLHFDSTGAAINTPAGCEGLPTL